MNKFFATLALIILLTFTVTIQRASSGESGYIQVGGQKYSQGQIIGDFLNLAFSDRFWNEDIHAVIDGERKPELSAILGQELRKNDWAQPNRIAESIKQGTSIRRTLRPTCFKSLVC